MVSDCRGFTVSYGDFIITVDCTECNSNKACPSLRLIESALLWMLLGDLCYLPLDLTKDAEGNLFVQH